MVISWFECIRVICRSLLFVIFSVIEECGIINGLLNSDLKFDWSTSDIFDMEYFGLAPKLLITVVPVERRSDVMDVELMCYHH